MKCQACGNENRQDVIWRIDRPKNALDSGHTLFCCTLCGHVYAALEAEPAMGNRWRDVPSSASPAGQGTR